MPRYITETRMFLCKWNNLRREYTLKSKRESRFALLLENLIGTGDVIEWWYELRQFHCKRMHRRERLYTPDFHAQLNTDTDVFDTGTQYVWVEVKSELDQNGKARFHCLYNTVPEMKDEMLLMVDSNPAGKRSKTAQRQRVLQDGACRYIHHVIYGTEWYPKFGIK